MEWMFTVTRNPILRPEKNGKAVKLRALDGTNTLITQLSVSQPYKTLGAYREPAQYQRKQFRDLLNKSKKHSGLLALSACKPHHTWVHYFSVFLHSVGYLLPISHLSLSDLKTIQKPMITIVLAKMRCCRNISRKLVFLCSSFGGLDFRHFYIEQGTGQLLFIIRHLRTPGKEHDLLLIVLSWLQNCAGVGFPVLERPSFPLLHLVEGHWLFSVREFLDYINGALEIINIPIQSTQRNGDFYLMEKPSSPNDLLPPTENGSISTAYTSVLPPYLTSSTPKAPTLLAASGRVNDQSYTKQTERPNGKTRPTRRSILVNMAPTSLPLQLYKRQTTQVPKVMDILW
jgi:hypothetical protein